MADTPSTETPATEETKSSSPSSPPSSSSPSTSGSSSGAGSQPRQTIDLSTKVRLDGGDEVSLAELVKDHTVAAQAQMKVDQLKNDLRHVLGVGGGNLEDSIAASKRVMLEDLGMSPEDVEAILQETNVADDEPTDPQPKQTKQAEPQQPAKMDPFAQAAIRQVYTNAIETGANSALSNRKEFQPYLKAVADSRDLEGKQRGDEGRSVAEKALKMRIVALAEEKMKRKWQEARVINKEAPFQFDWIDNSMKNATDEVVKQLREEIPNFDSLGRVGETAPGESALLRKPPVPMPEFKREGRHSLDKELGDHLADTLARELIGLEAEVAGDSA